MGNSGEKNITVQVTTGSVIKILFLLLAGYLIFELRDLVLVILTSVVLAASIEPATKWFARYKVPRVPAVLIVYFLVVSLFVGVFSFFVPVFLNEASEFLGSLPHYIDSISAWNPVGEGSFIKDGGVIANELSGFSLRDIVVSLRDLATGAEGNFLQIMVGVFGGIFSFILIVILSFYFSVQEDGIQRFLE
ncbi:MAG TPA: AI-2E family transporter, partial [Candidatus Yonathbacteria bacterium]|nr:AI-2E family transporter [Candidatus Yonathbacteria bacterium]